MSAAAASCLAPRRRPLCRHHAQGGVQNLRTQRIQRMIAVVDHEAGARAGLDDLLEAQRGDGAGHQRAVDVGEYLFLPGQQPRRPASRIRRRRGSRLDLGVEVADIVHRDLPVDVMARLVGNGQQARVVARSR